MACRGFGTRLPLHVSVLALVALMTVAATTARAQTPPAIPDEVATVADEAGVDGLNLLGAVFTTGLDAREYLYAVGELMRPARIAAISPSAWPIGGGVGQRLFCIEAIESTHGAHMYNPTPWYGEHAQGWLGWLPSTARRWGAVIGNRASEWAAAARMLAAGAGSQFYGVAAGRC